MKRFRVEVALIWTQGEWTSQTVEAEAVSRGAAMQIACNLAEAIRPEADSWRVLKRSAVIAMEELGPAFDPMGLDGWLPIATAKHAPAGEPPVDVLLWVLTTDGEESGHSDLGAWNHKEQAYVDAHGHVLNATHWMPLPTFGPGLPQS
jgi:hypothetical protein